MILSVKLEKEYDIVIERESLCRAGELLNLNRKVLIVTDKGVPDKYSKTVASQCKEAEIVCVPQGEGSKSFGVLEKILSKMLSLGFTRGDCIVSVGGGVAGDLGGFAASIYMRGIDFYNIPTTVLSQVDSSIGGKTAINLDKIKNVVGTFYQPKKVLIDIDVLKTLPERQIAAGLAEAVKMSVTSDRELFELFEKENPMEYLGTIIERSLRIKASVVEEDERENGLRKILNFGHTIGHGIESYTEINGLYHGECVALGMIPMCNKKVRERLIPVLEKLNLPTSVEIDEEKIYQAMIHDKKSAGGKITVIKSNDIGSFEMENIKPEQLKQCLYLIAKGER